MPLFSFNPHYPSRRPHGHGTTFRIDPWGSCATAFHVIEDLLVVEDGAAVLRDDIRLVALELEGLALGHAPLLQDSWRRFEDMVSICAVEQKPLQKPQIRNVTELALIRILRSGQVQGQPPFLPMDLQNWQPKIGETVMALGYPDLDVDHGSEGDDRPFEQYMHASKATIVEIQKADRTSGRPWPVFRVEANWPGGMSGGPVFNDKGNVIGIVSTGLVGGDIGTATYFSGWNLSARIFVTLDPSNPGWIRGWAGFDASGAFVGFAGSELELELLRGANSIVSVKFVTANPATGDYMVV